MAQDIVLRKRSRDGNKVCTTYGISDPSYKFTFETCDDIEAIIKDSRNNLVTILTPDAPTAVISKKGNYNICIEGIGIGTLYAEWTQGGGGEECCDELREKDIQLQNQITNLKTRLDNQNITGGTGISVTKTGDSYTITNTGGGGGGLPDDFDIKAGSNVQVSKSGNAYTVSATDTVPDVDKAYVDQQIAANKTVVQAGTNVTVTKNGNTYTVSATGGGLPSDFNITAGNNVQVSKSGNAYTISATDTVTTVKQGTNTTVTKNGNEYTVNAVDTVTTVKQGTNTTVTKNGNEYTVSADDAKLKQAINVTCDIGGIPSGTTYPVGTSIEAILRALLTCTDPPTPVGEYLLFTSEITSMSTWAETWKELRAGENLGEYVINLADTYEEHPVKFDIPADMPITDVQLYNKITAEWVTARDFDTENITRTIDGVSVPYVRYTDNREVNGIGRPVKLIWTV